MSLPPITVVYLTFRGHTRFEWFASSLERELRAMPDYDRRDLQVVVIDGRYPRPLDAPFPIEHHLPKPTVWQGRHRLTKRDYFCAANARNTAFALARHEHVAFVDDLSVILPGWLKAHVHAAEHGYVLCGTTCKQKNIKVNFEGDVVSYDEFPPGLDSRLGNVPPTDDIFPCTGGWLYGGTFSVPLEDALCVNGQDEIHDGIGGEDYDFGARLERAGSDIYITRACGTFEDEDGHHAELPMVRLDKPVTGADGPYSSNFLYYKLQRETDRSWTIGNRFNLGDLRAAVLAGEPFPVPTEPTTHWVDGQPLSEM